MQPRHAMMLALALALTLITMPGCQAITVVDAADVPQVNEGVVPPSTGTDPLAAAKEAHSATGTARRVLSGAQQFEFQAEVNRLMDIIIHSLYSNKDIFLRELISNASDALDKIRFLSLTDKSQLGEGDTAKLEIQISLDTANKVLYVRDRGVGMTKEDLIKNLGTIAKSGTSAFLEQMQKGGDVNLIGQFGVGFYSVYLVADWVEVVTKHNDDKQYVWSSGVDGGFSIAEDTDGEALGRGTLIKLHLKPEALEYAEEAKLKELVSRYSEFINFPIYLLTNKTVQVPVEDEEEAQAPEEQGKDEAAADDDSDDVEDDDGTEEEDATEEEGTADKAKKTKSVTRPEWELLNDAKAIWLRSPKDVTTEEYNKFYRAINKDYEDPLGWAHFKAEGDVEFKAVVFLPRTAPFDFYDKYYEKGAKGALKLYVRRVFITDDADTLLPRWLGFLRGLVDSDTLPLNVSREMMQQHAALKTIKKKLVRKVLDLIKKWAEDDVACRKGENDKALEEPDSGASGVTGCELYGKFWAQYGRAMKLGVIEDATNRGRLAKLLRFHTSKHPDTLTSFEEYVERMKEGQKDIYYLAGANKDDIGRSPFVEKLLKKGYEVVYFTDVMDEYVMQHMLDYEDKKFVDVSKEDLKLAGKDAEAKKKDKELKSQFKGLTKWWAKVLGGEVSSVKVSNRLATTPCVVVASKYGHSANMERILRAQAFQDSRHNARGTRLLEINPRHPLIKALKDTVEAAGEEVGDEVATLARLLYDTALIESGYISTDPKGFTARVQDLVRASLNVSKDAAVEEEDEAADDGAQEEDATGSEEGGEDAGEGAEAGVHDEL